MSPGGGQCGFNLHKPRWLRGSFLPPTPSPLLQDVSGSSPPWGQGGSFSGDLLALRFLCICLSQCLRGQPTPKGGGGTTEGHQVLGGHLPEMRAWCHHHASVSALLVPTIMGTKVSRFPRQAACPLKPVASEGYSIRAKVSTFLCLIINDSSELVKTCMSKLLAWSCGSIRNLIPPAPAPPKVRVWSGAYGFRTLDGRGGRFIRDP